MITKKETKLLLVLDGWGHSTTVENNAIALAKTPVWDKIQKESASTLICTSGLRVGLPDEQMGNSEVGHMNIGAGRIVKQDFTRIHNDIESGDFYRNPVLRNAFDYATYNNKSIHIMGMLSDGGFIRILITYLHFWIWLKKLARFVFISIYLLTVETVHQKRQEIH